jgi:hypothetical protein
MSNFGLRILDFGFVDSLRSINYNRSYGGSIGDNCFNAKNGLLEKCLKFQIA